MTDTVSDVWTFLQVQENREVLGWLGGGICVLGSAIWAIFLKLSNRRSKDKETEGVRSSPDASITQMTAQPSHPDALPRAVWVMAGLGALLIVWAIVAPGTRVTMEGSTFVGGSVRDSEINNNAAPQSGQTQPDVEGSE